jgi:hypothetical protein
VPIEVNKVVRVAGLLSGAQHLLHPRHRRRTAEIDAHVRTERVEGIEQRFGREPRVDEPGVGRTADDVENVERQLRRRRLRRRWFFELPPYRDAVRQAPLLVGHELPRQPQQRRVLRGDRELARFGSSEELFEQSAILRGLEHDIVQQLSPAFQRPFDALRPHDRAAVPKIHVVFQVPPQVLVIVLGHERLQRAGNAHRRAAGIGKLDAIAGVARGLLEEDAQLLHGRFPVEPVVRCRRGPSASTSPALVS